jgi:hypothetical protein
MNSPLLFTSRSNKRDTRDKHLLEKYPDIENEAERYLTVDCKDLITYKTKIKKEHGEEYLRAVEVYALNI